MSDPGSEGALRLVVANGADGRPWELVGRVEPMPGCASDVIPGYRLTLIARPTPAQGDVEVLRVSPARAYASWVEAVEALRRLAADVAADLEREAGEPSSSGDAAKRSLSAKPR